ncbi:prolyl oligopeptidase family-domain-containing protein [Phlyctochytrium arcticum]|nr:prolyl oligopeptidase family-domain-containing protein [Phlyctochytrium arcticum]
MRSTFIISLLGIGAHLAETGFGAAIPTASKLSTRAEVPPATENQSPQPSTVPSSPVGRPPNESSQPRRSITYPQARKEDVVDNYSGSQVADPYRWLEALKSDETQKFLMEQNQLADQYLKEVNLNATLEAMLATDYANTMDIPKLKGDYYYYSMRATPLGQKNLYRNANKQLLQQTSEEVIKTSELLVDPSVLSPNGISSCVIGSSISPDKTKFICTSAKVETDYGFTTTFDITRAPAVMIDQVVFTKPDPPVIIDTGYAYLRQKPGQAITWENAGSMGEVVNGSSINGFFHKYGTNSTEDIPCPLGVPLPKCSDALFGKKQPTGKTAPVRFAVLNNAGQKKIVKLVETPKAQTVAYVTSRGNDTQFEYFETDMVDPTQRHVFSIPLSSNNSEARILTTLSKAKLQIVNRAFPLRDGTFMVSSRNVVVDDLRIFDAEGKVLYQHPDINGVVTDIDVDGTSFLYTYGGYTQRPTTYRWDKQSKTMTIFQKSPFDVSDKLVYSLEWATSKDGTKIPMSVVKSKTLKQDGNNPVFTTAYGGFDALSAVSWSQQAEMVASKFGGIFAKIHARGDTLVKGDGRWQSAKTVNKPRTIEDILAAGQWFVDQKWSSNGRISINGHSNGGLMTSAACIQGRELYGACLAEYGVHDVLRQEVYSLNKWGAEFGNPKNKTELDVLLTWAPLVNIRPGTRYPAIYIDTGDHDTRVHPMHSFKLAAALQAAAQNVSDARPVILRTNEMSGHNPSVDYHSRENWARRLTFWAEHVGATLQKTVDSVPRNASVSSSSRTYLYSNIQASYATFSMFIIILSLI